METHIYTTPTSVICIDEETGKAIWQLTTEQVAALREAGEKMAKQLRALRSFQAEIDMRGDSSIVEDVEFVFNSEDAAALAEWEAANK